MSNQENHKDAELSSDAESVTVEALVRQCADTKKAYIEKCKQRWYGIALQDALHNWKTWKEMDGYLKDAMRQFLRNPFQKDMNNEYHNPDGTLTRFLWHCQEALQPDKHRLDPFLDFEEHYQKIFLKRGLLIYCELILDELESKADEPLPLFDGASA